MANKLEIKLVRGVAGQTTAVKNVLKGLGLKRRNHTVVRQDTPAIRGMVFKIIQCLEVKVL